MNLDEITRALLASYETDGGINHLEGTNLPSQESLNRLCVELMYLLFPGFFEDSALTKQSVAAVTSRRIQLIRDQLVTEIEKSLRFERVSNPTAQAEAHAMGLLKALPDLRQRVKTDVSAAYEGDPAARSIE